MIKIKRIFERREPGYCLSYEWERHGGTGNSINWLCCGSYRFDTLLYSSSHWIHNYNYGTCVLQTVRHKGTI